MAAATKADALMARTLLMMSCVARLDDEDIGTGGNVDKAWRRAGGQCPSTDAKYQIIQIVPWDGVCNRQAINSLRAMRRGDRYLFYHSSADAASHHIVGVVEVAREWYEGEGEAASGGVVDVRVVGEFRRLVALGDQDRRWRPHGGGISA
ncbi:hypothetical protein OsI_19992 [Oryza sativa Indica Group]|uniref:EVE domain-containing protein n=1 Tax=Oryza sativa subsp. indica TaxID=39946 RepID=B8AYB4_ORYSI|nr:hypothetical protein OsI_19992 [Oryza sativa Indica Group]